MKEPIVFRSEPVFWAMLARGGTPRGGRVEKALSAAVAIAGLLREPRGKEVPNG